MVHLSIMPRGKSANRRTPKNRNDRLCDDQVHLPCCQRRHQSGNELSACTQQQGWHDHQQIVSAAATVRCVRVCVRLERPHANFQAGSRRARVFRSPACHLQGGQQTCLCLDRPYATFKEGS